MDPSAAVEKAMEMAEQGAQIIDLGGESTRPGSDFISEEEEIRRVLPVLEKLPTDQFVISIDTTKTKVAQLALEAGAHLINDVSMEVVFCELSLKELGLVKPPIITHIMLDLSSCIQEGKA